MERSVNKFAGPAVAPLVLCLMMPATSSALMSPFGARSVIEPNATPAPAFDLLSATAPNVETPSASAEGVVIAAIAAADAAPAEPVASADGSADTQQSAPQQNSPPAQNRASGLRLPGLRVWGSVAYDLRLEDAEERRTTQHLVTTTVNAAAPIWQPWFAIVSGGLGYTVGKLSDGELSGRDNFLTGYARLNLFPQSRFPFEAHFEKSDSRINSGLGASASYESTSYGVVQRYRPVDAGFHYTLSYDHNTQDSSTTGEDVQDLLNFDATRNFKQHSIGLNANWNRNRRLDTGERTLYRTLVAQHRYAPSSDLSVHTVANISETDNELRVFRSQFELAQLSSYGFWRDSKRPLTVSGGARLLSLSASADGSDTETQQLSGDVGASYLLNPNTRLTGGLSLSRAETEELDITNARALAGISYQSDTRQLGKYSYDWFGASDVTYTTTSGDDEAPDGFILGLQAGHSLGRGIDLGGNARLMWKLSQSVSAQSGAVAENTDSRKQLLHSASVTWSKTEDSTTTFLRLSANDARYLNGQRDTFQLLNFQATRSRELGQYSSWAGNLTIQSVRQQTDDSSGAFNDRGFVTTASADLTYVHQRVFGVPRLRFFSQLKINRDETLQLLGSPSEREELSWENRLDYTIGRLESRLILRFWEIEGQRRGLLMWRLIRQFGD